MSGAGMSGAVMGRQSEFSFCIQSISPLILRQSQQIRPCTNAILGLPRTIRADRRARCGHGKWPPNRRYPRDRFQLTGALHRVSNGRDSRRSRPMVGGGRRRKGSRMMRKTSLILLGAAAGAAMTLFATQPQMSFAGTSAKAAVADTYRQLNLFGEVCPPAAAMPRRRSASMRGGRATSPSISR
jgi:hypothetical protein